MDKLEDKIKEILQKEQKAKETEMKNKRARQLID